MATPSLYCIQVKGYLPAAWSELLEGMHITCHAGGFTTLRGLVRDQADLYGLVAKLQSLGLELISIGPGQDEQPGLEPPNSYQELP